MKDNPTYKTLPEFAPGSSQVAPPEPAATSGYVPLQSLPAQHANYFFNRLTANSLTAEGAVANVIAELKSLITQGGGTINPASTTQVLEKVQALAAVAVDNARLMADTTINLLTTDTVSQKQAKIDAAPKNLNGYTLTFRFQDGAHSHATGLVFKRFYGGRVIITGNPADTSLAQGKSATINYSGTGNAIFCDELSRVEVTCFSINCSGFPSGSLNDTILYIISSIASVYGMSVIGHQTLTAGRGIIFQRAVGGVSNTYFTRCQWGLLSDDGAEIRISSANGCAANLTDYVSYGSVILSGNARSERTSAANDGGMIMFVNALLTPYGALGGSGTYGAVAIPADTIWIIPSGVYMMTSSQTNNLNDCELQVWNGTSWVGNGGQPTGLIISDGINWRVKSEGVQMYAYYRQLT